MKKRILFITVVIIPLFVLSAAYGLDTVKDKKSKQPSTQKKSARKVKTKASEMTKNQMLAELKEDLASTDEVFDVVQGLKVVIGTDGRAVYTYNGVALEKISKEDMAKLFGRVRQALVKIRTDRIQRQLEITKQVERLQSMASPRQSPRTPSAVPSVPKVPSSPPATPERR